MSIENATVTGWRPATRQDLIDLIDGGEHQWARFRDKVNQDWNEALLIGYRLSGGFWYVGATGQGWRHCEIKTQVLRDPKFSDLDNGPVECMIYPDGGHECPQKGILVGMTHKPTNKRNTTGMEYQTLWLYEKDKSYASVSHRWHVMVVDKSPKPEQEKEHEVSVKLNSMIDANGVVGVAIAYSAPQAPEPEQTSTGWRTPTELDLKDGPIACEVRDCHQDVWTTATLRSIDFGSGFPYSCNNFAWKQCRIKVTEPAPQAPEPEQTSTGWRTPTVEDLKDGPIDCEVRDCEKEKWTVATLGRIDYRSEYPYMCFANWKQCRIKATEPAPQARFREVGTGDEGKQVEFLDERTGEFVAGVLARFVNRGGFMLPVDYEGVVHMYARIHR
jgi:hypothetical protein